MISIATSLKRAISRLEPWSDLAYMEAAILLAFVLKKDRSWLYTWPEKSLSLEELETFDYLIEQRKLGKPIAYLLGEREFWSLPLKVTENTLIPRHETELLVELTLKMIENVPGMKILDLGTGSGAIALALAFERPHWEITAIDKSEAALAVARENAQALNIHNIRFYHSNWFDAIEKSSQFHAIVSNPPYLSSSDPHLKEGDLRYEPEEALVAGSIGLEAYEIILSNSHARLIPGGLLLVEHGNMQKKAISSMLYDCGYDTIAAWQDYQGRDRVSSGRKTDS